LRRKSLTRSCSRTAQSKVLTQRKEKRPRKQFLSLTKLKIKVLKRENKAEWALVDSTESLPKRNRD
jgi:hypothetical protein